MLPLTQEVILSTRFDQISKPEQKPFVMNWWAKDYIFLPPKYLDDLRRAENDHLSFFKNISDVSIRLSS